MPTKEEQLILRWWKDLPATMRCVLNKRYTAYCSILSREDWDMIHTIPEDVLYVMKVIANRFVLIDDTHRWETELRRLSKEHMEILTLRMHGDPHDTFVKAWNSYDPIKKASIVEPLLYLFKLIDLHLD